MGGACGTLSVGARPVPISMGISSAIIVVIVTIKEGACAMDLTVTTPALLFPAISLLLLAYTNRFLSLAALTVNSTAAIVPSPTHVSQDNYEIFAIALALFARCRPSAWPASSAVC